MNLRLFCYESQDVAREREERRTRRRRAIWLFVFLLAILVTLVAFFALDIRKEF